MAQKVVGLIKLQIPAGKATPAPPVGPALGQHGVNIVAFTKDFNERTKNDIGLIIPVVITVYEDRSFTFITKTPPAAVLIKKACGIETASGEPNKTKVASITKEQIQKGAKEAGFTSVEFFADFELNPLTGSSENINPWTEMFTHKRVKNATSSRSSRMTRIFIAYPKRM